MTTLAACDQALTTSIGGLGTTGGSAANDSTSNTLTGRLTLSPGSVQLRVGSTVQLTTNAPTNLQAQLQWRSLQPAVASISTSGLVTALSAGTATIVVQYSFDANNSATSTILVTSTPATGDRSP